MKELDVLKKSKEIIYDQIKHGKYFMSGLPFSKYQKVYFSSNENIKEYLSLVNIKNKDSALTVMGSGDQVFNLICKNIMNIDTFDTNLLTDYYVMGLKRSMILKYNYYEFKDAYNILNNEFSPVSDIYDIISELLPYMDSKYRYFWSNIIEYIFLTQKRYKTNINPIYLLFIHIKDFEQFKFSNYYLHDIDKYNKLKNNISKVNISFKNIDARELDKNFNKEYDLILLSNILDYFGELSVNKEKYFTKDKLVIYLEKIKNLVSKDGTIFLNYIFYYKTISRKQKTLFKNSSIEENDIPNSKVYPISSPIGNNCSDGIILTKKY